MPATCQRVENKLREVKTILRSLLISKGSRDVTVRQLNNLYREMEDSNIPFKSFNYASLIDFLQSMPDTLRLLNSRTGELCVYHVDTEKSAHVSSLVARQKKTVGRKTRSGSNIRSANFPAYNYSKPAPTHNQIPDNELLKILQQLRESVTSNSSQNFGIRKVDVLTKIKEKFDRLGKFDNTYTIQNLNRQLYQFTHLLVIENDYIYFNNEFSNRKKNINHKPEPRKPVISNNSKLYTVPQTENNISQNCNNNDTDQNSKSILNNSNCSKAPQTESNLFQNCNDDVEEKSNSIIENITNEIVKGRTRIRLENLIKNHPEGIWCSELPTIYKKEFGVHLEYNELGFNNITEFVAALPDIFVIVEPPNTKKQMVLDAKANNGLENLRQTKTLASLYNIEDYTACDPEPVPIKLSSSVSQALIPEGVMNLNEIIDQVLVTSLISEEYVEVIVSEVFNPSFFWITLRKNKKKIRALMSELGEFYMDQDLDVYKIPQVVLGVGLHVACLYNNLWHRGVIKKIKPDGFVIVFFNDYGTVKTYNPNELYFLNKRFSSLPGQAIPCGLYNIRPIESSEWTTESTDAFVTKVWNVPLIAIISNIDEENNSMMVTLTDTSDDITDLHINDWMVENNWAEWGKMVSRVLIQKLCMYDEMEVFKVPEGMHRKSKSNSKNKSKVNIDGSKSQVVSPNPCPTLVESHCDTSNIAALVKENMDLIKQTNTITQAILLNMPINKADISNNNYLESKNIKLEDKPVVDQSVTKSTYLDNKIVAENLNSNLSTLKINVSKINHLLGNTNSIPKGHLRHSFDLRSSLHSFNSDVSNLDNQSMPTVSVNEPDLQNAFRKSSQYLSEYLENQPSIDSTQLYDFDVLQNNNNQTEKLSSTNKFKKDYDQFSFNDGTFSYEIKVNSNLTKSNSINIKHPINSPNLNLDKFKNTFTPITVNNNSDSANRNLKQHNEPNDGYFTDRPVTSQTFSSLSSTSNVTSSNTPMYTVIYLSEKCEKKPIHVFHLYKEGWLSLSEFVDVFTNLKDQRIMLKLVQSFNYDVNFKYLTREKEPQFFSQLDKSSLKVPREGNKKIEQNFTLIIMPLKATLHVLTELGFLNPTMLKEAVPLIKKHKKMANEMLYEEYNNKILYDILNVIVQYKEFKRLHSSRN